MTRRSTRTCSGVWWRTSTRSPTRRSTTRAPKRRRSSCNVRAPAERNDELEALLDYIKRQRGFDFTGYKRPSLTRRFEKRMQTVGVHSYRDYLDLLEAQPQEFADLFDTVLINVTSFFRDRETWEYVAEEILPQVVRSKGSSDPIRVWSTGCATGEEAYTAAIVLAEALGGQAFAD